MLILLPTPSPLYFHHMFGCTFSTTFKKNTALAIYLLLISFRFKIKRIKDLTPVLKIRLDCSVVKTQNINSNLRTLGSKDKVLLVARLLLNCVHFIQDNINTFQDIFVLSKSPEWQVPSYLKPKMAGLGLSQNL